ncbi:MAG: M1 family aminopeptidase [Planctomycetota bacterium]|jgi:aminopeptidase N
MFRFAGRCVVLLGIVFSYRACDAAEELLRTAAPRPVDIRHIALELDVDLKQRSVIGTASIDFVPLRKELPVLKLDAIELDVQQVAATGPDGATLAADWETTDKHLLVLFPGESLPQRGESWRVTIRYSASNPKAGLYFFGPSADEPDVPLTVWSQGEPRGSRYWFPCLDQPNEKQTTELIATVDVGNEVLSNGTLVSRTQVTDAGSGRPRARFHWKQQQEHVAYLVSMVIGEFVVEQEEWRGRPVTYYVPQERAADLKRTFGRTKAMLDFFSEKFGIEYPWDKYAQVVVEQFIWGGMENTSATTLYDRAMHDERAILDSTPDWLIAHELGHQWWGDLVTCRDWTHLWLNEGFATYSEVLWAEHALGRDARDWHLLGDLRSARTGTTQTQPVVDRQYRHPGSMFDSRVYPKGGWLLHMLRSRLGDEDFFRGLARYGTVFAYQSAETNDLRLTLERLYGVPLERFFFDFGERPGHPELLVESDWLVDDKLLQIKVSQTQKAEPYHIPLQIEVVTESSPGATPAVIEKEMTEREFTMFVPARRHPQQVRVDPNFTLLATIKEKKSNNLWKNQLASAGSIYERIRAAEHFGQTRTDASRKELKQALENDSFYGVRVEAAKALARVKGDVARDALIAGLRQQDPYVRAACATALSGFEGDEAVIATLQKKNATGDASYKVEAEVLESLSDVSSEPPVNLLLAGLEKPSHREVIRNAALHGLGHSRDPEAFDVLIEWTTRRRPYLCRAEACRSLADYCVRNDVGDAQIERVVDRLVEMIEQDKTRMRSTAASALGRLGSRAKAATNALEQLVAGEPNDWTRDAAKSALEQIRTNEPKSVELERLRREVEEAHRRNKELSDRLLKLESR